MPTTVSNTYVENVGTPSQRPELATMERRKMTVSLTLDPGAGKYFIAVGIVTSTGKVSNYDDANSPAGIGVCKGLLPVKAVSDSSGNITIGGGTVTGQTQKDIAYYTGGYFLTAEITGLDAAGLADLGGHLIWGDLTTGEIVIPV